MLTGESNPRSFTSTTPSIPGRNELAARVADFKFALAVREAEFKRREEALKHAKRALALPRVPAEYFDAGHNSDEDSWWSKQLGRR